ncbi:UV-endonuclease UvdE [Ramaria rubella]|nr:UV-endonuclease UvdE [Ramaria rubella]
MSSIAVTPSKRRLTIGSDHLNIQPLQTGVLQTTSTEAERFESPLTELESDSQPSPNKKSRRRELALDNSQSLDESPKKRKAPGKAKDPVVYDIKPVEMKETTYRGRLGFACLNTILRVSKPDPIFCSRTCRIDTIVKNGIDFVKNLALQNVLDLAKLIQWNEDNKIRFMRMSSELFPYASHLKYGYDVDFAAKELKAAGDLANDLGHRLTAHPGQFTQLASPKEEVVQSSIRELAYHSRVMELMGLGPDSVLVIHMGGMYGDKAATLARFKINYETKLSQEVKARLVLENDEICYNLDDLMPVCEELNIPIVVDYHHDWINPSTRPLSELISVINKTWHRKGIRPKQHLSSPRPGAMTVMDKRAHADRCDTLPDELPDDMDLMIEAKDKEQAVFHLYRIYGLESVVHENLRPEKPPALETNGRKGKSRRKKST